MLLFRLMIYEIIRFCKEQAFNAEKTSTFMSIMQQILSTDSELPTGDNTVTKSFIRFEELLMKHSVDRPPKSIKVFDREDLDAILEFANQRYNILSISLLSSYMTIFYFFSQILPKLPSVLPHLRNGLSLLHYTETSEWHRRTKSLLTFIRGYSCSCGTTHRAITSTPTFSFL